MIPAGSPMMSAMMIEAVASWIVTGSFCRMRLSTGSPVRRERPKSPWITWPSQAKNCTTIGSSIR